MTEQVYVVSSGNTTPIDLPAYSDDGVLALYEHYQEQVSNYRDMAGRCEQEIARRMVERGATAIPSDIYVCESVTRNTYDQTAFTPFKEMLSERELGEVFTPAHLEEVQRPDAWDTRGLISAARKHGTEAMAIIERARIPGAPRLKFARREAKDGTIPS